MSTLGACFINYSFYSTCYVFFRRSTFYRGNKSLPAFEWNHSMHTYKVNEIAQALLNDSSHHSKICHCAPTNVEHNCTFLIDQSKLKSPADIKADDSGSWKNNGVRSVVISVANDDVLIVAREKEIKRSKILSCQYLLTRSYYVHQTSKDFRKILFTLNGK